MYCYVLWNENVNINFQSNGRMTSCLKLMVYLENTSPVAHIHKLLYTSCDFHE